MLVISYIAHPYKHIQTFRVSNHRKLFGCGMFNYSSFLESDQNAFIVFAKVVEKYKLDLALAPKMKFI